MDHYHVSILGSTGSIGGSALEVLEGLAANGDEVFVAALTSNRSVKELAAQVRRWRPALAVVADASRLPELRRELEGYDGGVELLGGEEGINRAAIHEEAEVIVNALVGGAGLVPTVRALEAGKRVALANKEALVIGGNLVTELARDPDSSRWPRLMPVDSEHSALFQALGDHPDEEVERLILTASGGPFRKTPVEEFPSITPQQALRHPTWNMGKKITIDSATLMNKGLEVIEAHWLFGLPVEKIGVVIHPQSIVHSLVEFIDGNILAHFSVPDMRLPIQYALTYPQRKKMVVGERLGIEELGALRFEPPDEERFPALGLCRRAVETGGTLPAVLNAANEVAVSAFLAGELSFPGITEAIGHVMEEHKVVDEPDLEELIAAGAWAARRAEEMKTGISGRSQQ
ncbi:MAG: 1-deoxy-D-xylulose-5-phosphate reductoisomerase [Candidatus Latescibacteria bacterium]|nr:1-deoxy-D-xylulose-5-phosphate reductoisomerase [Candidatus Latescibacterota bacterium]